MKGTNFKLILLICFMYLFSLTSQAFFTDKKPDNYKFELVRELNDDDYDELRSLYRIEEKDQEKEYQETALHPERYDVNKDRRISRRELTTAINFLIFPKSAGERRVVNPKITSIVNTKISDFINNRPEFINYREFSYVIMTMKATEFVDSGFFDEIVKNDYAGLEYEADL